MNALLILKAQLLNLLRRLRQKPICRTIASPLCRRLEDKKTAELAFQLNWAKEFSRNRDLVERYWRKYRYLNELEQLCEFTPHTRVLDVGCGISTVLHYVKGERVGVDPLGDIYNRIYRYPPGIIVIGAPGERLPLPDASFDVAFCSNVLDHVDQPAGVISEIRRVLRPAAVLLLTVEVFPQVMLRDPAHPHCFTTQDVHEFLATGWDRLLEGESPWIGLRNFVSGDRDPQSRREMVLILRKNTPA
jgi:SAM-dependent methyltransferase